MDRSDQLTSDAATIAPRLTPGQRSTIAGLDRDFCILGCAEPTARRLAKATPTHPALIVSRRGDEFQEFALNDLGMAVKELL